MFVQSYFWEWKIDLVCHERDKNNGKLLGEEKLTGRKSVKR